MPRLMDYHGSRILGPYIRIQRTIREAVLCNDVNTSYANLQQQSAKAAAVVSV